MGAKVRWWVNVVYLALAGWVCVLVPWSQHWLVLVWSLPPSWARVFAHPACRGALSGFGVLHFLVAMTLTSRTEGQP